MNVITLNFSWGRSLVIFLSKKEFILFLPKDIAFLNGPIEGSIPQESNPKLVNASLSSPALEPISK